MSEGLPYLEPGIRVRKLVVQGSELGKKFENVESLSIRALCRSSLEIYRQAIIYLDEHNLESALMLFARFVTIGLEHLPKHSQYSSAIPEKARINQRIPLAMKYAENLKNKLKVRYEDEYTKYKTLTIEKERVANQLRQSTETEQNKRAVSGRSEDIIIPPLVDTHSIAYPHVKPSAPANPDSYPSLPLPSHPLPSHPLPSHPLPSHPLPSIPTIDRSTKPVAFNESGNRTVIVPASLPDKFLQIAKDNTARDIETMGILSGKLIRNEFVITHMIIPKQTGGPNSCESDQDDVYSYQDQYDLMSAGWIHTHPSQTAFLSSVDLHSHLPYQLLRPEAIAIVCAPAKNQLGVFMLTEMGLDVVRQCSAQGFHPHDQDNLFQECPHAHLSPNHPCVVADLRGIRTEIHK